MFNLARYRRACIAAFVIAGLGACSGGAESVLSTAAASHARGTQSLVGSAPTVTATLIQPLTFSVGSNLVATVSLYGTAQCGAPTVTNPCPGTNFTAATYGPASQMLVTMGASSLNATCTAPSGAPSPAPGFTAGCYVVALEGGLAGPFFIQGPAVLSGGTLSLQPSATTLSLDVGIAYNFFLAYVSAIGPQPTPTPYVPSPSPLPTTYATPLPPTNTPTPAPLPGLTPTPSATCASDDDGDSDGHHRHKNSVHKQHRGGDNDECESDDD